MFSLDFRLASSLGKLRFQVGLLGGLLEDRTLRSSGCGRLGIRFYSAHLRDGNLLGDRDVRRNERCRRRRSERRGCGLFRLGFGFPFGLRLRSFVVYGLLGLFFPRHGDAEVDVGHLGSVGREALFRLGVLVEAPHQCSGLEKVLQSPAVLLRLAALALLLLGYPFQALFLESLFLEFRLAAFLLLQLYARLALRHIIDSSVDRGNRGRGAVVREALELGKLDVLEA